MQFDNSVLLLLSSLGLTLLGSVDVYAFAPYHRYGLKSWSNVNIQQQQQQQQQRISWKEDGALVRPLSVRLYAGGEGEKEVEEEDEEEEERGSLSIFDFEEDKEAEIKPDPPKVVKPEPVAVSKEQKEKEEDTEEEEEDKKKKEEEVLKEEIDNALDLANKALNFAAKEDVVVPSVIKPPVDEVQAKDVPPPVVKKEETVKTEETSKPFLKPPAVPKMPQFNFMDKFKQEASKDENKKVEPIAAKAPTPPPPPPLDPEREDNNRKRASGALLAKKKEVKDEALLAAVGGLGAGLVPGIALAVFLYMNLDVDVELLPIVPLSLAALTSAFVYKTSIPDDTAAGTDAKNYDTDLSKNIRTTFSGLPKLLKSAVVASIVNLKNRVLNIPNVVLGLVKVRSISMTILLNSLFSFVA